MTQSHFKTFQKVFKTFFANMVETLLEKLPHPQNKFNVDSLNRFYKNLDITTKFQLKPTTEDAVLNLLRNIEISKATGIDKLPERCLKDGVLALAKPMSQIRRLSIKLGIFPDPCKLAKLKLPFIKDSRMDPQIIDQIRPCF